MFHHKWRYVFLSLVLLPVVVGSVTSGQDCLTGDVNLDGQVDLLDTAPLCDVFIAGEYMCEADIVHDGIFNILDLGQFGPLLQQLQQAEVQDVTVDGPGDFFWSTDGLSQGAVNQGLIMNLPVGQSVRLNLYYTTNGPSDSDLDTGAAINVAMSTSGVLAFEDAGTYNFSLDFMDTPVLQRWNYPDFFEDESFGIAPPESIEDDLIVGMFAYRLCNEDGIGEEYAGGSGLFQDSGYDADADAFLHAFVDIQAVTTGVVQLVAGPNNVGIVHDNGVLDAAFAEARITAFILGDVNRDGAVNLLDVEPFIATNGGQYVPEADINQDGFINLLDVAPFVALLAGG